MGLKKIQKEMIRNYRVMNLCLNMPIEYKSNVVLTDELFESYVNKVKENGGNMASILREMIVDNIMIQDVAEKINFWGESMEVKILWKLLKKYNWIENIEEIEMLL